jgi:hypothetical protein
MPPGLDDVQGVTLARSKPSENLNRVLYGNNKKYKNPDKVTIEELLFLYLLSSPFRG